MGNRMFNVIANVEVVQVCRDGVDSDTDSDTDTDLTPSEIFS